MGTSTGLLVLGNDGPVHSVSQPSGLGAKSRSGMFEAQFRPSPVVPGGQRFGVVQGQQPHRPGFWAFALLALDAHDQRGLVHRHRCVDANVPANAGRLDAHEMHRPSAEASQPDRPQRHRHNVPEQRDAGLFGAGSKFPRKTIMLQRSLISFRGELQRAHSNIDGAALEGLPSQSGAVGGGCSGWIQYALAPEAGAHDQGVEFIQHHEAAGLRGRRFALPNDTYVKDTREHRHCRKPSTASANRRRPPIYQCVEDHFETFEMAYDDRFERQYGFFRSRCGS